MRDGYDQVNFDESDYRFDEEDLINPPSDEEMEFWFGVHTIDDLLSQFDAVTIIQALKEETLDKLTKAIAKRA